MASDTRYIIDYDPDAQFEECNGEARPLTETEYAENYYNDKQGNRVSYADYLAYQGNPDRHVYLEIIREDKCPCCGSWVSGGSLCRIDFMDDDKEAGMIGTFTLDQLLGYLKEVAEDLDAAELHTTKGAR